MTILDIKAVDEEIKKAIEKLDIMYLDNEEREIYENDLKAMRDYKAGLKTAERKGIEKGIEKGIAKGKFEVAKNLLKTGLSVEQIAEVTGLQIEEIKKLKS